MEKNKFIEFLREAVADQVKEYYELFVSGRENPHEFVKDYESRSWFRRNLWMGAGDDKHKYEIAKDIITPKSLGVA